MCSETPFPFPFESRLPFSSICKIFIAACRDANVFQSSPDKRHFYHLSTNPRKRKHWEIEPDGDATVYLLNRLSKHDDDPEYIPTQDMEHFTLATDRHFENALQTAILDTTQLSKSTIPDNDHQFLITRLKSVNEGVNMILNSILEIGAKSIRNDTLYIENGQERPGVRCEDVNDLLNILVQARPYFENYHLVFKNM